MNDRREKSRRAKESGAGAAAREHDRDPGHEPAPGAEARVEEEGASEEDRGEEGRGRPGPRGSGEPGQRRESEGVDDEPDPGEGAGEVVAAELEREEAELGRLRDDLEEARDRHLRLAAEFENFRRRSHAQLGESTARAQAALVGKIVDILDDFERVSALEPEQATADSVLEGVALVERKLHRVLEEAGLEPIEPEGEPFDPNEMEAMLREPAGSPDEDETVARVLQKGFRFRGHLVRPARVSVLKYEDQADG